METRKTADYADFQQTTDFTDYTEIINAPFDKRREQRMNWYGLMQEKKFTHNLL